MLAGAAGELNVTALRREEAPAEAPDRPRPGSRARRCRDDHAGSRGGGGRRDRRGRGAADAAARTAPAPAAPARRIVFLDKPFIQIGIFSVEENAATAVTMRQQGMVPTVREQTSQGKTFWRVVVGPAPAGPSARPSWKKIKGVGFEDAYAVTD